MGSCYRGARLADHPSLLRYLPRLLLYPLRPAPALAIALFAFLIFTGLQSIVAVAALAIAAPWLFAFLDGIIESSSQGEADAPRFGGSQLFMTDASSFKAIIWPGLIATAWFHWRDSAPLLAQTTVLWGAFLLPAYLLASTKFGLITALNPLRLMALAWVLGLPYLLACALFGGSIWLLPRLAGELSLFSSILFALYLLVMICHLLGYLAFQRAERLGLDVRHTLSTEDEDARVRQQAILDATLRLLHAALRRKDREAALAVLRTPTEDLADPPAFQEALFSAVALRPEKAIALDQGERLLLALMQRRQLSRALSVYRQCLDISPHFFPTRLTALPQLARHALAEREHALFDAMCEAAEAHADTSDTALELGLLRATDLMDRRHDDAAARAVIQRLRPHDRSHRLSPQIETLARLLGAPDTGP